jgi:hypothetical protein
MLPSSGEMAGRLATANRQDHRLSPLYELTLPARTPQYARMAFDVLRRGRRTVLLFQFVSRRNAVRAGSN